jgi:hypothetical protein
MSNQTNQETNGDFPGKKLTLEARIIIALVKRLGADEIEISAEELANAVGVAIYPNDDASCVIVKTV